MTTSWDSQKTMRLVYFISTAITLVLMGCGEKVQLGSENVLQGNSASGLSVLPVNVNQYASNKLVCNPLSDAPTQQTNYEKGIKAELFYLTAGMPRLYSSLDYLQFGKKSDQNIFLTDVNVPTRMFTEGFSTAAGSVLKNDEGQKLIEYFGLKMKTNLMLTPEDADGEYELALLSDDGATLILKSGTGSEADDVLIQNDGDHPTRMGCASHTIRLKQNIMQPIEITYYQGPRAHISNVLIWRKSKMAATDPLCGQLGNNLFFNPDAKSEPQQAFQDLLGRGWSIVKPNNFMISSTKADYNPCVSGTNPVISNLTLTEVILTTAGLTWTTDIPATSQVQLTNTATGEITTTTSDNMLRTKNIVELKNLQSNTLYRAQAISVSADLGRSISSEILIKTQ